MSVKGTGKIPEEKLKYHREYYKKWLMRPGNREKKRKYARKGTKKWLAKPGNREKHRIAVRNWIARNFELKKEITRQNMRRIRLTPAGLAKNRANSKKYRAIALRDNPDKYRRTHRNLRLKKKYGITADQWDAIFEAQGKCCAICKSPHARWERGHWHTDHDHELNIIRGILCNECNIGIGKFGDNPAMLQLAIEYLQRFKKHK